MKKFYRGVFIALLACFFLFATAAAILIFLVDPNNFKEEIGKRVYQETGRTFRIAGNIRWTLFPWLGIEAHDVKLGNTPDFSETYFAQIDSLSFQLGLRSILAGQLSIDTLRINGLRLELERFENGSSNWEVLEPGLLDKIAPTDQATTADFLFFIPVMKHASDNPVNIHISHIEVRGGQLDFIDHQKNTAYHVWNLVADARGIQQQKPFDIRASFEWEAPFAKGPVQLESKVTANMAVGLYALSNFRLKSQTPTATGLLKTDLLINAGIDATKQEISLSLCHGLLLGVPIEASLSLIDFRDPIISGHMHAQYWQAGDLRLENIVANLKTADQRLSIDPIAFDLYQGHFQGKAIVDLTQNTLHPFSLVGDTAGIQMALLLKDLSKYPSISGTGEAHMAITGELSCTSQSCLDCLKGQVRLAIKDGSIIGLDIGYWLNTAQSSIRHKKAPPSNNQAKFSKISGTIDIDKGTAKNTDMLMEATGFSAKGSGTLQLLVPFMQSTLTYQWQAHTPEVPLPLAIRINGPLASLSVRPDLDAYARALLKQIVARGLLRVPAALLPGGNIIGLPLEEKLLNTLDK